MTKRAFSRASSLWASALCGIAATSLSATPAFAEMLPSTKAEWKNFRYQEIRSDCRTNVANILIEYSYLPTTVDGVDATADVVILGFKEQDYRESKTPLSTLRVGHPVSVRTTFGTLFNGVVAAHKDGYTYFATDQHLLGQLWYDDMMGLNVYLTDDTSNLRNAIIQSSNDTEGDRLKLSKSLSCAQEHRD